MKRRKTTRREANAGDFLARRMVDKKERSSQQGVPR
jgi:hypothetical protein